MHMFYSNKHIFLNTQKLRNCTQMCFIKKLLENIVNQKIDHKNSYSMEGCYKTKLYSSLKLPKKEFGQSNCYK